MYLQYFCYRTSWGQFLALIAFCMASIAGAQQLPPADSGFEPMPFVNYESPHVHPIDLTPDRNTLLVVNTAAATLLIFDVSADEPSLRHIVPVGLDPVSVRARTSTEAWVVNHISDSISIVDLDSGVVQETVSTRDEPADVIFAGNPQRAFVTASQANLVQVFDPFNPQTPAQNLNIRGEDPRALARSPDGSTVYAAIFESGNGTTLMPGGKGSSDRIRDAAGSSSGPWGGQTPPPNSGQSFDPPLNPNNPPPPPTGVIVRKDETGQWMDDNGGNWTSMVSGPLSAQSDRVSGWDLPDRDVAIIDANSLAVSYQPRLMNMVMALDVNPVTGDVYAVGTEAFNEIRFEPNLQNRFVKVQMASFNPQFPGNPAIRSDLNPHIDYSIVRVAQSQRERSVGDPRAIAWRSDGSGAIVVGMGSDNIIEIDGSGARSARIDVGKGPTGIVLDDNRARGYVLNRFDGSISTIQLNGLAELSRTPFYDPTPDQIRVGRTHLYGTHEGSGLGHVSCASCHVDGRTDRLSWDLGNPAGEMDSNLGQTFHPMKGPMKTQSLQDIIGSPVMHHRGDRNDLLEFATTFENLQGDDAPLDSTSMLEFEAFLDSIHFGPNPNRNIDNTLSTSVPIPGPDGSVRGFGDAQAGLDSFLTGNNTSSRCATCHLGPRSRGVRFTVDGSFTRGQAVIPETFSGFYDRIGLFWNSVDGSTAGFGFRPDGAQSSEFQHRNRNFALNTESGTHVFAYQLSIEGPLPEVAGGISRDSHAGVGQQVTLSANADAADLARLNELVSIANSGNVGLIARGNLGGQKRGFAYQGSNLFQSDRLGERFSLDELRTRALAGVAVTFTLVPRGVEYRLGLDADLDGLLDRDELDVGGVSNDPAATTWVQCADDNGFCSPAGRAVLRFGNESGWVYGVSDGSTACSTALFGDPGLPGAKRCEVLTGTILTGDQIQVLQPTSYQVSTLDVGRLMYSDRSYTYTAASAPLLGLPVVQAANDDKLNPDFELSIAVTDPSDLFLAWDSREVNLPAWLSDWELTDLVLETSDSDALFRIYRKRFGPGTISLGATGFTQSNRSMYLVAIDVDATLDTDGDADGGCGSPNVNPLVDSGVYVWKECTGDWNLILTGEADAGTVVAGGTISSDLGLVSITPRSLESSDTLVTNNPANVAFDLRTSFPYEDRFTFESQLDDNVCVSLGALSPGYSVFAGPDRTPVSNSFNPETLESCTPPTDQCAPPTFDPGNERALFTWVDCAGQLHVVGTGAAANAQYIGHIYSDTNFINVEGNSLEPRDVLTTAAPNDVYFDMAMGGIWIDEVIITPTSDAVMCIDINAQSTGTQLFAGTDRTPVTSPFNPVTLASCTPPGGQCTAHSVDPAIDEGLFIWKDCSGNWAMTVTGESASGGSANYAGTVTSDTGFGGISLISVESSDSVGTTTTQELAFNLTTSFPWEDSFEFTVDSTANLCVTITEMPSTLGRFAGSDRTPVSLSFDPVTLGSCL